MPEGTRHPMLEHLDPLVGEWTTEATHQLMPGTVVRGEATFEWLEGGHFLIERSRNDHPDFPDAVSIFGPDDPGDSGGWEGCSLHYFDSRGVSRVYTLDAEPGVFRFTRDWPGFSQRFTGTISADGDTIAGVAELCEDGTTWQVDLRLNYSRVR